MDLVPAAGVEALTEITWRHGTEIGPTNPAAAMRSRFVALRIRPANRTIPRNEDGVLPQAWLLADWPVGAAQPTDFCLSTMPEDRPLSELLRLAKIRSRIEHDYRKLKTGLGLDHFEGRSWPGRHHHVTLITAAHLFLTTLRLTDPRAGGRDHLRNRARTPTRAGLLDRHLPDLSPHLPDLPKSY